MNRRRSFLNHLFLSLPTLFVFSDLFKRKFEDQLHPDICAHHQKFSQEIRYNLGQQAAMAHSMTEIKSVIRCQRKQEDYTFVYENKLGNQIILRKKGLNLTTIIQ